MYSYFNKTSILNFYKTLKFTNFATITPERKEELDDIVNKNMPFFKNQTEGPLSLMNLLAERLTVSYKRFGLLNGDEKAYFYIKILDPTLQHLAVYEAANTVLEQRELAKKNLNIFDKYLIFLEKMYNEKFQEYEINDLWSRDSIRR